MRTVVISVCLALACGSAFAVVPQFWRARTADEFLSGDIDGFAVTSRGELRPGPSVRKVATFTDPFVLAQTVAPNGDRFFGTGNDGKVYRLRGTTLEAIFTAAEPEIYAIAFRDGAVYAASSPNGKVYRIDAATGKGSVFYDPKQAYIWTLAFNASGDLLVGTGVEGKLFQIAPSGVGKLLYTAPETHIRCLALRSDGTVLAGGSGQGRIYAIRPDGTARALWDSPLSEISAIYVDPSGVGWAAGANSALPTSAPANKGKGANGQNAAANAEPKKESEATAPQAEVTVTFDENGNNASQTVNGELYRIDRDDFVETARKFEHELIYAISSGPSGAILLATGPQGRVYSYAGGELALIATVPEKQVVSLSGEGKSMLVTTTNSGAVYRLDEAPGAHAEFRSPAKDVERFSRFGHYHIDGSDLGSNHLAISFRSGNTRMPDSTWSAWSMPATTTDGRVDAPPARYIQWKLTLPKPSPGMVVSQVTVGFMNRNVAPVIDSVAVADPAVVYLTSGYPASPQVVEATNPDEYGIFTSLEPAREKNEPGKKVYRRGFRTLTWHAHDDNGDGMRYSVAFRRQGSERWLRLRDDIEESQINFDTSQLPDGRYELRLTATDAPDNADAALTDVKDGIEFDVDNTPPVVTSTVNGDRVTVHVTDAMSPVGRVEYSVDAQKWIRVTPTDGIADSPDETYSIPRAAIAGKFVIVRAVDSFFNVATVSVSVP